MAKEKPGVMVYWETFDVLESLVDGDAKAMMSAIRQYSQYGALPDFADSAILSTLWLLIRPKLDADSERYENIREQRRAAINSRWEKERSKVVTEECESIQPYTEEYERIRNVPTTSTTTTATTSTTTTATTTAETTPETVLRDKGKGIREKGRDLTIPSPCTDSDNALGFEEHRRRSIEEFKAEVERRKREAGQ